VQSERLNNWQVDDCCIHRVLRGYGMTVLHMIFINLNGQVSDLVMFGQMADISHICGHHWYSLVVLCDSQVLFPEEAVLLVGRYL
jgi:hypothetical protein